MDIAISADSEGDFGSIETATLGVTGRDGYGEPTPTVRELIAILQALPEQCMDLPVGRYCDEGIAGLKWDTSFPREERDDVHTSTRHVRFW